MEVMTLNEAIQHCEEVAKENREYAEDALDRYNLVPSEITKQEHDRCKQCAAEHSQLVEWLKDYKRLLEQESCEDAISRADVLDLCDSKDAEYEVKHFKEDVECLPSVRPEPKTGEWIFTKTKLDRYGCTAECSSCHKKWKTYDEIRFKKENNYCPNCGCCMVEPQESEGYTMIFEVGKTYQHTTGKRMTIIGRLKTHTYGECLIGEHDTGELVPVGECADGWHESEDKIWQI